VSTDGVAAVQQAGTHTWTCMACAPAPQVMAAMRITHLELPHQVAAFCALTGWPHEDLLDPLAGPRLEGEHGAREG
jgi:hypothetical protein